MKRIKLAILAAAALVPAASMFVASAGQNLVTNGDFSNGVAGWNNFSGNPQPFFGGMVLTNDYAGTGNSYYSAYQCIAGITPGYKYTLSGDAVVVKGAPKYGSASLMLHFYESPDCSGPVYGGGSASGGSAPATHGEILPLKTSAVAGDTVKSAWVRLVAQKEPKAPDNTAPGTLYVAFDDITLTKALIVQLVPLDPKPEDPKPEPDDPQPEPEQPQAEPEVPEPLDEPQQPEDKPQQQPADNPQQQPADEPQTQTTGADQPSDDTPATPGGEQSTPNDNAPSSNPKSAPRPVETSPLPPETGQGEQVRNIGWMVIAGCLAAIAAGGMMVLFAVRTRAAQDA